MRAWLFEFQAWCCREWNIVQDFWWWNCCALPEAHAIQGKLARPSVKACVWLGPSDCYRDQLAVLGQPAPRTLNGIKQAEREDMGGRKAFPSGQGVDRKRAFLTVKERGGVTPFNCIATGHGYGQRSAGAYGHGAGTPEPLADWWIRYISPEGATILDPFSGSGTMGVAAVKRGRSYIGIEKMPEYHAIAERRIAEAQSALPLFDGTT